MLPAFFAFTGMRTQMTSSLAPMLGVALIIGVATAGKFAVTCSAHGRRASAGAAPPASGFDDTRGLMELIVLTSGSILA